MGEFFPSERQYTTSPTRYAKVGDILLSVRAPVGAMNIAMKDCCIGRGLAAIRGKYCCNSFIEITLKKFATVFARKKMEMEQLLEQSQKMNYLVCQVLKCGHCGGAMMPTYGKKNGRRYHYYLCCKDSKRADAQCPIHQLPAGEIEEVVKSQLKVIMTHPSVLTALSDSAGISCTDILQIFESDFWAEISAGEYKRLVQLLIARVVVLQDHIEIEMKTEGIKSLIGEFCNARYHSS